MKKFSLLLALACSITCSKANNIQLANVGINGQNTVSQYSLVNFDVSWENSWRTITNENNYDGAWIFVKFRKKTSNVWQHATINTTGSTIPAGSVIQTSADRKGVWIYHTLPASDFTGNVNYTGAKIRWNYGLDGVLNTDSVEIRVFALEMVFVPTGAFKLGSGGDEFNHFFEGSTSNSYNVTSESAITVSNTAGNLYYSNTNGIGGDINGPIPATYPKGYAAMWMMKYEASQQQYADFLNNIDMARATNRFPGLFTGAHPNYVAPAPERAMATLSMKDVMAFADWAALRPFTEMEYEKACRGYNQVANFNEFPWGNTTISSTSATTNPGLANETANNGNANYLSGYGLAVRNGIYATATSNRQTSGATYYGIMEMAGNVVENCITVGSANGRAFNGSHGDGELDLNGEANAATWPTASDAMAQRGGGYNDGAAQLRTSDRYYGIFNAVFGGRYASIGLRAARTAE